MQQIYIVNTGQICVSWSSHNQCRNLYACVEGWLRIKYIIAKVIGFFPLGGPISSYCAECLPYPCYATQCVTDMRTCERVWGGGPEPCQ
uniref:Uncharacterized protein n=1 Tax=Arundo donax TaxID=35708 RepID=A0A0A9CR77_ARUDO